MSRILPWWEPKITGHEAQIIQSVLDNNYVNEGDVTTEFENAIAELTGAKYVVGVTSGTAALFLGIAALDIGPGDEVIVPDLTFIASANAVKLAGADPILVDIDPETLNISPAAVEAAITSKTRAIMPVHVSGRPADMAAIRAIAQRHDLKIVEDAAEAFMSRTMGQCLGTIGEVGCLSFSPNKTITTGQGGAVLTDDPTIHERLRELKDQGRPVRGTGGDDLHPTLGFNFKLTNLQAAVGLAQLTELSSRLDRQREIYLTYAEALADIGEIRLPPFAIANGETPLWTDAVTSKRDELDTYLQERGIGCRRFWHPLHRQPPYLQADDRFPQTTELSGQAIWLPSAFTLTSAELDRVCSEIREFFGHA